MSDYIPTIGLEIHIQLSTKRKMFAREQVRYGALPNSQTSPLTLGHPGTMPYPNKEAIRYGIRLGLACGATITRENRFARKHYHYADLPKGYQITQDKTPIGRGGALVIPKGDFLEKVALERIHLEEDTGQSLHSEAMHLTRVNFNRAGTPLIEMVTQPVIKTPDQAYDFLYALRRLVRHLGISDGDMEKGSLRCDVNVSVRPKGQIRLNTKVEVKNLNSMRQVKMAILHEIERQSQIYRNGGDILPQTRSFDPVAGVTHFRRSKESAEDYSYFPEPDITPFIVEKFEIDQVAQTMPPLPHDRYTRYRGNHALSHQEALWLLDEAGMANFFEKTLAHTPHPKRILSFLQGPIKFALNHQKIGLESLPLSPKSLASLIELIEQGGVSFSSGSQVILPELLQNSMLSPEEIAQKKGLLQIDEGKQLQAWVKEVMAQNPDPVARYRKRKKGLLGFFMGEVMRLSQGKAHPKASSALLKEYLDAPNLSNS